MTEHRISLPEYAKTFLSSATRVHTERVIVMFHRWLLERCMELSAVTGKELQDFLDRPSGKAVKPRTANSYRWELKLYLQWLAERGLAGPFEKQELEGYHRKHLPDEVRQFLRHLAPTRKPSTGERQGCCRVVQLIATSRAGAVRKRTGPRWTAGAGDQFRV